MARLVHLIRHGEVENPRKVVYATLEGFGLSAKGRDQAFLAGRQLSNRTLDRVVTSPLDRAQETADLVAAGQSSVILTDYRLTEWSLTERWAGTAWAALDAEFPGELNDYLTAPERIIFATETLAEVAQRVVNGLRAHFQSSAGGDVAFVSHQDPIQAARLALTTRSLNELHVAKPTHASIVTLAPEVDGPWQEINYWEPPQGREFPPTPTARP